MDEFTHVHNVRCFEANSCFYAAIPEAAEQCGRGSKEDGATPLPSQVSRDHLSHCLHRTVQGSGGRGAPFRRSQCCRWGFIFLTSSLSSHLIPSFSPCGSTVTTYIFPAPLPYSLFYHSSSLPSYLSQLVYVLRSTQLPLYLSAACIQGSHSRLPIVATFNVHCAVHVHKNWLNFVVTKSVAIGMGILFACVHKGNPVCSQVESMPRESQAPN